MKVIYSFAHPPFYLFPPTTLTKASTTIPQDAFDDVLLRSKLDI